jgi:hypothetical protein
LQPIGNAGFAGRRAHAAERRLGFWRRIASFASDRRRSELWFLARLTVAFLEALQSVLQLALLALQLGLQSLQVGLHALDIRLCVANGLLRGVGEGRLCLRRRRSTWGWRLGQTWDERQQQRDHQYARDTQDARRCFSHDHGQTPFKK